MKRFTSLIENYNEEGLKSLSKITEEPDEEQFNKEVKMAIDKSEGKIRNKKISKPEVFPVEMDEDTEQGTPDSKPPTSDTDVKKLKGMKKEGCVNIPTMVKDDKNVKNGIAEESENPMEKKKEALLKKIKVKISKQREGMKERMTKTGEEMKKHSPKNMTEEIEDLFEKTLTPAQKRKAEEIVKSMKSKEGEFQKKYGEKWKNVMYGSATAIAKRSA